MKRGREGGRERERERDDPAQTRVAGEGFTDLMWEAISMHLGWGHPPRILYEKLFNFKNFWQSSLLHKFFNITNKSDAV